jgi:hypothetical protein
MSIHADMVSVRIQRIRTTPFPYRGAGRGAITEFSRKSRKRMIDKLAKARQLERPLFLTFTYPDECWFARAMTGRDLQAHLDALIERFKRFCPDVGMIWRKEWEDRKSGEYLGQIAPHLHVLLTNVTGDLGELRTTLRQWWYEIITSGRCDLPMRKIPRVDVQAVKSRRHAMYYVSKYLAKAEDESEISNYFRNNPGEIGRHWGVVGKWDTSAVLVVRMTRKQYLSWRRAVSRWLKSNGSKFAKLLAHSPARNGCSVYGLGDMSSEQYGDLFDSAAMRLLWFVLYEE